MRHTLSPAVLVVILLATTISTPVWATPIIRSAAGLTAADITPARDQYRLDLGGGTVAGANGSFGGVRREINWDGVPDSLSAPNNLPANFFNVNSPRGALFSTLGTGFEVSANAGVAPVRFDNIDPIYSSTFAAFSPQRLFTALGSNIVDVNFFVAGTSTPAAVHGFGAVFTDVDLANTTSIAFFDPANNLLGTFFVPAQLGSQTFSFLGVSFNAGEQIRRVRITNGNTALGLGVTDQNGNLRDLVVMDDFLYSEPAAVPQPGSLILIASASAILPAIGCWLRRRDRSASRSLRGRSPSRH